MFSFIKMPEAELRAVILNTAERRGIHAAIVEKDLWVCLTLHYLFQKSKWKERFVFKGGTCLSKVYHLIDRFSEDIDLILDWRVLGYDVLEPWEERSNTKQLQFIIDSKQRLFDYLRQSFLPEFIKDMTQFLGYPCNAYIDNDDPGTVIFAYPHAFSNPSILGTIRLEIGALASWTPFCNASIKPMIDETFPGIIENGEIALPATTPERTFWEKATILHQEAYRPIGSIIPKRYSRHYYDIYCMCKKGVYKKAMLHPELLDEVAHFKRKFYPRGWARYDLATIGSLKLMPAAHSIERLKEDYEDMKAMIYGDYPTFDEILSLLSSLEREMSL